MMDDDAHLDGSGPPQHPVGSSYSYAPSDVDEAPVLTIVTRFEPEDVSFSKTARSVQQQSLQQWEWLVVCFALDADARAAVHERCAAADPRIRLLELRAGDDIGAAGREAARAPYVLEVPPGTVLEPTAAEKFLWFLVTRPEITATGCWSLVWGEGGLVRPVAPDSRAVLERKVPAGLLNGRAFSSRAAIPEYLEVQWPVDAGTGSAELRALRATWPELPHASAGARWGPGFDRDLDAAEVPQDVPFPNALAKQGSRLLLISSWLTSREVDTWNLDLVAGLTGAGWDVSVATTREGDDEWLPRFAAYTPDIFLMHRFLRPADYPRFLRYLISSRSIDVVMIAHSELGYLLLPYLRAHCRETAFLDYCLCEDEHWKDGGFPALSVQWRALLDGTITSSEHLRGWMVARGADPARVAVVSPNVDTNAWHPDADLRARVRTELGVSDRVPILLYPGRIAPQQRPQVFARVMQNLARTRPDFLALVAGDGPDLPALSEFIEAARLEPHVRLLGLVPHDRLKELIVAADLAFLPSHGDGVGLTAYQALASGVPVVGMAVGGSPEIVTPDCGILIDRATSEDREVKAYTNAISSLLQQPVRLRTMGRAARERAEGYFRIEQMHQTMLTRLVDGVRSHRTADRPVLAAEVAEQASYHAVEHLRLYREAELRRVRPATSAMGRIRRALMRLAGR